MRNILLVAYHFPPSAIASGHLRTLALTDHLARFGWQPTVLSAHPRAYSQTDERLRARIAPGTPVKRAFAVDTARHLSFRGKYSLLFAQPDRWISWWFAAVPAGLRMIRRYNPRVIWSTYPITTAHLIAYTLHRISGLPWIADFRDPISNADIGNSRLTTRSRGWVERKALVQASACVFTTEGARRAYAQAYPLQRTKLAVVPNGFEERDFSALVKPKRAETSQRRSLKLVHSGLLYPTGRDPKPFLSAVATLREQGAVDDGSLQIVLRGSSQGGAYQPVVDDLGLAGLVRLEPMVAYDEALAEQAGADGLLLFQGYEFSRQIPAKVYEYLRIGRPIFALLDPRGDTAALLHDEGIEDVAPIDDADAIAARLQRFLEGVRADTITVPGPEAVSKYSRQSAAERYASLFNRVADEPH